MSETVWDVNDHKMHYSWEQSAFFKEILEPNDSLHAL